MRTAVVCTTFNRPQALARSLPQIVAAAKEVRAQVLIVDDGSESPEYGPSLNQIRIDAQCSPSGKYVPEGCEYSTGIHLIALPFNRGLAGALNIGLAYFLADPSIDVIHYFQDDVEVDPLAIAAVNDVVSINQKFCVTGHDAAEHSPERFGLPRQVVGYNRVLAHNRSSCRATHMAATAESWKRVMPIPSRALGLPSRTIRDARNPAARGTGSGVDWWIVRDSPNKLPVLCVPGLVRSFAHKREDSTWDNESIGGEEPPLHRDAIRKWVEARR